MYYMHAQLPQKSQEDIKSPGTGVTDYHESLCKCWELNPGPLQEQQMFLTTKFQLQ